MEAGSGVWGTCAFRARREQQGPVGWHLGDLPSLLVEAPGPASPLWPLRGAPGVGEGGKPWMDSRWARSGLPGVDTEAPLVSAAPSALIRPHGKRLLWNVSETQPASPPGCPLTPSAPEIAPVSSWSLLPFLSTLPPRPEVERVRAGDVADGWAPRLRSLTDSPPRRSKALGSSSGYLRTRCLHGEPGR